MLFALALRGASGDSPGFWPAGQKLRIPRVQPIRAVLPSAKKRPAFAGRFLAEGGGA